MTASVDDAFDDEFDVWYKPELDHAIHRGLMRRTDAHALTRLAGWFLLVVIAGYGVVRASHSLWLLPAMAIYGSVLSFSYAASHECAHGTAFKTRWLNELVFWITSLIFIEEPLYRRYSHAEHHTHTWFNSVDPQKPYGNPMTLKKYLSTTFGLSSYVDATRQLWRHSAGRFSTAEREFIPRSELARIRANSLLMSACYLSMLLYAIVRPSPWPFLLYFIPRYLGGCAVTLYINSQHMCMAEDLHEHRLTTRSIRCNPLERFLYWNMNFHLEHHLFPSVPFHSMPELNRCIQQQLPQPTSGVFTANISIVRAIMRQRTDPGFHVQN